MDSDRGHSAGLAGSICHYSNIIPGGSLWPGYPIYVHSPHATSITESVNHLLMYGYIHIQKSISS